MVDYSKPPAPDETARRRLIREKRKAARASLRKTAEEIGPIADAVNASMGSLVDAVRALVTRADRT